MNFYWPFCYLFLFLLLFLILFNQNTYSFPENIRHGYSNCTSCHYSPSGGGLITPYGRELSREMLSTWGKEGSEVQPLYGIIKRPVWLDFGGDLRVVQIYRDNPFIEEAKIIPMQFDVEAIAMLKNYSLVATIGPMHKLNKKTSEFEIGSRRHYVMAKLSNLFILRAGKFMPNLGINTADHIIATKRGLNFDEGSETYNIELSYISSKLNIFTTGVFGDPSEKEIKRDKGGTLNISYAFLNRFKIGGSYFYGYNENYKRNIMGSYAILGITEKLYLLSEWDFQKINYQNVTAKNNKWGILTYNKVGIEALKGFHIVFTYDKAKADLTDDLSRIYSFGPGLIWYPRPHYELAFSWLKQKTSMVSNELTDYAWLMIHVYL
ncbi:MAG: hypothetical protein HQK51_03995 [Oligoflexia bacterium]|nr:hypothetical protein [Oligoflexia bacterium]